MLKPVLVTTIPAYCVPLFLTEIGEHDVTLMSFMAEPPEPWKTPFVRVSEIDEEMGRQISVAMSSF